MKNLNKKLYNLWILKFFIVIVLYFLVANEIQIGNPWGVIIKASGAFLLILMFLKPKDHDKK